MLPAVLTLAVAVFTGQAAATSELQSDLAEAARFAAQERFEQARDLYERALLISPTNAEAVQGMSSSSERIALKDAANGDRDQALADLLRAQRAIPEDRRILYDLGVLEEQMSLFMDAAATLERLKTLTPVQPAVYYALARVHLDLGRLDDAEGEMRSYLQTQPEDASAHYGLGKIYLQALQYGKAETEFERSIQLQPKQVEAYYQLGQVNLQQDRFDEALKEFRLALARDAQHGGALVGMGTAYFKLKQYPAAAEWLRKAILAAPDYQPGHYYLGLTLARMGDAAGAKSELATSAQLAERANQEAAARLRLQHPEGQP